MAIKIKNSEEKMTTPKRWTGLKIWNNNKCLDMKFIEAKEYDKLDKLYNDLYNLKEQLVKGYEKQLSQVNEQLKFKNGNFEELLHKEKKNKIKKN